ncbi:MAG: arginine deiminase-related protein [Candidatus Sericytochromatia bacterium]
MSSKQLTNTILMVRPVDFSFNEETSKDNEFQNKLDNSDKEINQKALAEFENMVNQLREKKVNILVLEKNQDKKMPDAVFPNNWISTEHQGNIITYPMYAKNRRLEKNQLCAVEELFEKNNFEVKNIINIGKTNENELFLEGTGSLIIDHDNSIVYIAESIRSNPVQLENFTKLRNYKSFLFQAQSSNKKPIYHTNVIMSVAEKFAVICFECFINEEEKEEVKKELEKTKEIIEISLEQMEKSFCGNVLQVKSTDNLPITVMSKTAYQGFNEKQLAIIKKYGDILAVDIDTIEKVGGGSARCMMAEVFLPTKKNELYP